jgi:hypothetical protein
VLLFSNKSPGALFYDWRERVKSVGWLVLLIVLSSCSSMDRMAVDMTADLLYRGSVELETERNWNDFKNGAPANLKLLEGLLYLSPNNPMLLASLAKGYAGLAFAVDETLHWREIYADSEVATHLDQAILHYSKAVKYGLRYLALRKISYQQLSEEARSDNGIGKLFDQKLHGDREEDRVAVLFTAQSIGGLTNLQKSNYQLISQLSVVKQMFDWVCSKDSDIGFGACDIFYGAYWAARPKLMGGDPELGREIFLKLIKRWPDNWLIRIAYIQYYLIPMMDETGYLEQKQFMEKALRTFNSSRGWLPPSKLLKNNSSDEINQRLHIYRAIALKRFQIIKQFEGDLF